MQTARGAGCVAKFVRCSVLSNTGLLILSLQDVEELLQVMDAAGDERVPQPRWPFRRADGGGGSTASTDMTLREALTCCYDIRWGPLT